MKAYEALGVKPQGKVAVKLSTGEGGNTHYLQPALIKDLVQRLDGTIVECNTAYAGTRNESSKHWETIKEHGFMEIGSPRWTFRMRRARSRSRSRAASA